MNGWLTTGSLTAASILVGMEAVYGLWSLQEKEEAFHRIWYSKRLYQAAALCLAVFCGIWMALGIFQERERFLVIRFLILAMTYLILAVVDGKKRIVPDRILLCYLFSQILLAAASADIFSMVQMAAEGGVFLGIFVVLYFISRGRIGLGDVKLLGVTAMTAGWSYTVQILVYGLMLSFFYSVWLLLFRRLSGKTEIPFVPFLAAGMAIQMALLLKS